MRLRYKICITIIMSLLVVVTSIGRSYALWIITEKQSGTNLVASGCLNITYNDLDAEKKSTSINLPNAYPIDDDFGKQLSPYKVTIKNECTLAASYKLYLSSFVSNDLPEKNLKIFVSRVDDNITWGPQLIDDMTSVTIDSSIKNEIEIENNDQIKNSYILSSGVLNPTESKTYELRMWVSKESTNEVMEKTFKSIVFMEAVATENHL
ncbi:MAG: hypothetical protein IJA94_00575 [Bacilli bacterium]|nr:hypothetical protein [Bacilli bacterium]